MIPHHLLLTNPLACSIIFTKISLFGTSEPRFSVEKIDFGTSELFLVLRKVLRNSRSLFAMSDFRFAVARFRLSAMSRTSNVEGDMNGEIAN